MPCYIWAVQLPLLCVWGPSWAREEGLMSLCLVSEMLMSPSHIYEMTVSHVIQGLHI